jgi:hypothetical protein
MRKPTAREALALLRVTDPRHYLPRSPEAVTAEALVAREAFDLDAEMAKAASFDNQQRRPNGAAGVRLRAHLVANISHDLLREFAVETLGAKRCSANYLAALRIVLGNKADAQRKGYGLELNLRVSFATPRVMRTILDQMQAAGFTSGANVGLGRGRAQVVQCFGGKVRLRKMADNVSSHVAAAALERIDRAHEARDEARRRAAVLSGAAKAPTRLPSTITEADILY